MPVFSNSTLPSTITEQPNELVRLRPAATLVLELRRRFICLDDARSTKTCFNLSEAAALGLLALEDCRIGLAGRHL